MAIGLDHDFELMQHPETTIPISRPEVLRAMSELLESKPFRTSKQCQNFLRYVVLNTVDGRDDELKERVIGAAVLDRSPDYNTSDDPVVRIRAADVRKRLAMFYQDEGQDSAIRITIPSGSYRAVILPWDHAPESHGQLNDRAHIDHTPEHPSKESERNPAESKTFVAISTHVLHAEREAAEAEDSGSSAHTPPVRRAYRVPAILLGAVLLVCCSLFFVWQSSRTATSQFNLFWEPMIDRARPPIIYVGANTVYRLNPGFFQRYQAAHPDFKPDPSGVESATSMDPNERLSLNDLHADDRNFVGVGDVAAAVALSSLFNAKGARYDLRFGRDIVFGDFRTTPVVLIGAFDNRWTLQLNAKLTYRFTEQNDVRIIEGEGHSWQTRYTDGFVPRDDYALITRETSPVSGKPVITVAGLDQTGTRGAAEFVANPALLDAALRKLPSGWQNKRVQLILHISVLDYVPNGSEVIASSVQ